MDFVTYGSTGEPDDIRPHEFNFERHMGDGKDFVNDMLPEHDTEDPGDYKKKVVEQKKKTVGRKKK